MIQIIDENGMGIEIVVKGRITRADYKQVLPSAKRIVSQCGSFSAVVDITQAGRLEVGAIWEDVKFDVSYFRKTGRIAYVGGSRFWLWATSIPFATGGVRFFPPHAVAEARAWAFAP
jgi:hypothetical protein